MKLVSFLISSATFPKSSSSAFLLHNIMSKRPPERKQQASIVSFFQSNKRPKEFTTSAFSSAVSKPASSKPTKRIIYCDLDGVLVDFNAGVKRLFPEAESTHDIPSKVLWPTLAKTAGFFKTLPWTVDGKQLWQALLQETNTSARKHTDDDDDDNNNDTASPLQLCILTGCPMFSAAALDKYAWCQRELNVKTIHLPKTSKQQQDSSALPKSSSSQLIIPVITCRSKNKYLESGKGRILIDDRIDLKADWESKGGIFIHHTSTETTLKQLRDKKILKLETTTTTTTTADSTKDSKHSADQESSKTTGNEELKTNNDDPYYDSDATKE